jgi:cobalt-zinc-cadmium efflux system outer membrane protein
MPPRPGERAARTSRAEARLAEVTAGIEARELELATAVRKEFARRVAAEERLAAATASLALRGRVRDLVRGLLEGGSVTRLAANLVELEYAEAQRERWLAEAELETAARHLGRTLGLPDGAELRLQAGAGGRLPAPPLDPGSVPGDAGELVLRTPGLRAAKHRYEQAEQALRLACIRSWPWFTFGPAFERDGGAGEGTTDKLGVGLGFELPLFARGQGEIAELEARRDQLRDSYRTRLHAALGEAHDARRRLDAAGRLLLAFEQSVRPVLDENVRLTEAAFELGQVDLLQLVTTQDRVLRARMDYLLDQLAYREAWFDLEQALGAPLPRAGQERP